MLYTKHDDYALIDTRNNKSLITSKSKELLEELFLNAFNKSGDVGCYKVIRSTGLQIENNSKNNCII